MAKRFNKERAELSSKWQSEITKFLIEIAFNKNLSIEQIKMKYDSFKAEIDNLKGMPLFIEEEDL